MKTELITKLEELLTKDAGEVAANVRALQKEYQKLWTTEFETARKAFVDEGGKPKEFEYAKQAEDIAFEALVEKHAKMKKELDLKAAADQAKNLTIKLEIISKIKDLSKLSDNVGAAVKMLQELQTQWKNTGSVSSHKYKDVQADYSKAVEEFYYNLKIFRDLQEHDLKRNFELKSELLEKLKAIQSIENIKEAERLIKVYRNEWDEIGPVPNSKWEIIKQEYKAVLDETYSKIKTHYTGIEEKKETNLNSKLELIEKAKALVAAAAEGNVKWNDTTDQLIALQNEWKSVGRTTEKDNEKIWAEFRAVCDSFFDKKKEYFATLNEKFAANRKLKSELISKADALKTSTDWQKTSQDLIRLQETWKKHPSNGDKEEPKLFHRFRQACNAFFEAKKNFYDNLDASFESNLVAKEAILARFNDFKLGSDNNANREQLKAFSAEWNAAGMVPMKDKKRLNDAFYNRVDELYEQMNIDKKEIAIMQFRTKLDRLASSENGAELLRKESDFLKKISDEINGNIRTYDNNLGFFKSSKGSNSFMKEIEDKIAVEKAKIAEIEAKRKLINEELTKLRDADKQKAEA
jgi:DNA repair exonuclease SbcCD ATPase subunit